MIERWSHRVDPQDQMVGWSGLIVVLALCCLGNVLEASLPRKLVPYGAVAHNMTGEEAVRSKRCVGGNCVCIGTFCTSVQAQPQPKPQSQSASCPTCVVVVPNPQPSPPRTSTVSHEVSSEFTNSEWVKATRR
ncbi:hypothetical protein Y032_0015g2783 [Ancylostoma ceylanicum]|uniref:Uncharacterized protein n=1 Tax=Ancylostoma ceylanicum TaxID=53326 RepID=A0A016V8C6_9BILA|nr:hypothetical protein Y032_0015g2783 [Ancylostoma ceylanicum]